MSIVQSRILSYLLLATVLASLLVNHGSSWLGSSSLHSSMESVATVLALIIGTMSLVRYYTIKKILFLYIGVGFLGTGVLDLYHTIVTTEYVKSIMPSEILALSPWSWAASGQVLSISMLLSICLTQRTTGRVASWYVSDKIVYICAGFLTLLCFSFFSFSPLPKTYYPELFFHRPEEFIPGICFSLALYLFIRKGDWKSDIFEHWIVLSLIVGVICQIVFMSHSAALFDYEFDLTHLLKKFSYILVLCGLLISMHVTFRDEMVFRDNLLSKDSLTKSIVESSADAIITIDGNGIVVSINPAGLDIFGYQETEVLGKKYQYSNARA